jgi:hypothetical protein
MANPISPITDVIALAEFVGKAIGVVGREIDDIASAVGTNPVSRLQSIINQRISQAVVSGFITNPLNIAGVIDQAQAQTAIKTLENITSLILAINEDTAMAALDVKMLLGNHGGDKAFEIVSRIPQELGLNFFIGGVLHDMTMLAIEAPLLEAINIEARPARIDFRTLRLMLRQHLLNETELRGWLVKMGYPDDLISLLVGLADVTLTASEITSALAHGTMSEQEALTHLEAAGYSSEQAAILIADSHKANSEGATRYRTAARSAFAAGHISESQFRTILSGLGLAQSDVDLEIAAGQLEHHAKNATVTLSQIKLAFEHGDIAQEATISMLADRGYAQADALFIVNAWASTAKTTAKGLTENRILAYMQSGVLTKDTAYKMLIARGMRPEDANLLVDHPSASGSVYKYNLTPTLVQSALKDGAVSVDEATALLTKLQVNPDEIPLLIATSNSQALRAKRAQNNPKTLPEGTIKTAFENSIMSEVAAHRFLTLDGYSDTDATIIIATWFAALNGSPPDGWIMIT